MNMPQDHKGLALCMTGWPRTSSVDASEKSETMWIDNLETRAHILMECPRFTKDHIASQAPSLKDLVQFLTSNPSAFAFPTRETPLIVLYTRKTHHYQAWPCVLTFLRFCLSMYVVSAFIRNRRSQDAASCVYRQTPSTAQWLSTDPAKGVTNSG